MSRDNRYLDLRDEILRRYDNKCACCRIEGNLEIHHIVPVILGGSNEITNLAPLCKPCHMAAHKGRNIAEYVKQTHGNIGGRSNKIPFANFDREFQKYLDGRIGMTMLRELTGYNYPINKQSNPHFAKSLELRGIKQLRNNIDTAGVSRGEMPKHGTTVGWIKYEDGTKKWITFKDTGENKVRYTKKGEGDDPGGHIELLTESKPKKKKNVRGCGRQLSIFDFGVCG